VCITVHCTYPKGVHKTLWCHIHVYMIGIKIAFCFFIVFLGPGCDFYNIHFLVGFRMLQFPYLDNQYNNTHPFVPGRMPVLCPFVGGIRCIRFHPWFTQRVCPRHRRKRAESQTIWPITLHRIGVFINCRISISSLTYSLLSGTLVSGMSNVSHRR
jgi:hypothetical protein